ncbi:MAG: hypothetical protein QOF53_856 [Nocardioidaceae bacterium]|nr:hypothetical protein [Nocardioidaceae bacterium]
MSEVTSIPHGTPAGVPGGEAAAGAVVGVDLRDLEWTSPHRHTYHVTPTPKH